MEERVNELLPLAAKIASEFSNIPGLPHAEIDLAAQEALANAARHFDPAIRDGKTYSEIGTTLGVSKQAAHKLAGAAVAALRDRLETMGFHGVDTLGFLKSCAKEIRAESPQVDDFSPQP